MPLAKLVILMRVFVSNDDLITDFESFLCLSPCGSVLFVQQSAKHFIMRAYHAHMTAQPLETSVFFVGQQEGHPAGKKLSVGLLMVVI